MKKVLPQRFSFRTCVENVCLVGGAIFVSLCVLEIGLRIAGQKPGFLPQCNTTFVPVDTLEVETFFYTDDEGVFKAETDFDWPADECRINSDGFRSIEFEYVEIPQKKIFFVGDSFTWGGEAKPLTESFVDRVSRQGFLTYNAGIPATAHNQYAYLVEKYVPVLKPDVVAVMFFMGNDITLGFPMQPNKNLFHITNAGWIYGFDTQGNALSPQQAYDYYLKKINATAYTALQFSVLHTIRTMLYHSVVGTHLWGGGVELRPMLATFYRSLRGDRGKKTLPFHQTPQRVKTVADVRKSLERIKTVAEKNNSELMLFLLPIHPKLNDIATSVDDNLYIFDGFDPIVPDFLSEKDYVAPPDGHFNNSGHAQFGDFIIRTINHRFELSGIKDQH